MLMGPKLFRVTIENVLYVVAPDELSAVAVAQTCATDELEHAEIIARAIKPGDITYVDPDWRDAPPYGGDGETTCAQIVAAQRPFGASCAVCGQPQSTSPSGTTCPNGHGGADAA